MPSARTSLIATPSRCSSSTLLSIPFLLASSTLKSPAALSRMALCSVSWPVGCARANNAAAQTAHNMLRRAPAAPAIPAMAWLSRSTQLSRQLTRVRY